MLQQGVLISATKTQSKGPHRVDRKSGFVVGENQSILEEKQSNTSKMGRFLEMGQAGSDSRQNQPEFGEEGVEAGPAKKELDLVENRENENIFSNYQKQRGGLTRGGHTRHRPRKHDRRHRPSAKRVLRHSGPRVPGRTRLSPQRQAQGCEGLLDQVLQGGQAV